MLQTSVSVNFLRLFEGPVLRNFCRARRESEKGKKKKLLLPLCCVDHTEEKKAANEAG